MNIHHVLCDPYLVSFPFYTIPICLFLKIHRIFYLLVVILFKKGDKANWGITLLNVVCKVFIRFSIIGWFSILTRVEYCMKVWQVIGELRRYNLYTE